MGASSLESPSYFRAAAIATRSVPPTRSGYPAAHSNNNWARRDRAASAPITEPPPGAASDAGANRRRVRSASGGGILRAVHRQLQPHRDRQGRQLSLNAQPRGAGGDEWPDNFRDRIGQL